MKRIIQKIKAFIVNAWKWFNSLDSRMKYTIVCFLGSLAFGYGFGLGAGFAAEYKDKAWGGEFDWWDIAADMVGTIIGGMVHYLIFGNN